MIITKKYVNDLSYKIVGAAIEVHNSLGPGLLESVYEKCLAQELLLQGLKVEKQAIIPIEYKGITFEAELRADLIVNNLIVVELKAVDSILPIHKAQLITYLKLLKLPKGLLINFNSISITESLVPLVTEEFSKLKDI
ncbi:MAG: GxxExxY protein [Ignavibacterium sp.]|nr:GxxExxY protein [Ignavibacterium sp.]MDW8376453.1 GxxExxY protein [Ignavibacteriales bacterium]